MDEHNAALAEAQEQKDLMCVYCHEPIKEDAVYPMELFGDVQRTCMHPFHKQCIGRVRHSKYKKTYACPICEFQFTSKIVDSAAPELPEGEKDWRRNKADRNYTSLEQI